MTTEQEQAIRTLRIVRYSPKRGRHFGITAIARASGYSTEALYAVVRRGWCSRPMAERLANVFRQTVNFSSGHTTFSTPGGSLGPLDASPDPRGGPRHPRRRDDARLRSARQLRDTSATPASGRAGTENAPAALMLEAPHKLCHAAPVAAATKPADSEKVNSGGQTLARELISLAPIRIDIARLLERLLR